VITFHHFLTDETHCPFSEDVMSSGRHVKIRPASVTDEPGTYTYLGYIIMYSYFVLERLYDRYIELIVFEHNSSVSASEHLVLYIVLYKIKWDSVGKYASKSHICKTPNRFSILLMLTCTMYIPSDYIGILCYKCG